MISISSAKSIYQSREKHIPNGIRFFREWYRLEKRRFAKEFRIKEDLFIEVIIVEQKRILRLADLRGDEWIRDNQRRHRQPRDRGSRKDSRKAVLRFLIFTGGQN